MLLRKILYEGCPVVIFWDIIHCVAIQIRCEDADRIWSYREDKSKSPGFPVFGNVIENFGTNRLQRW